MTEFAAPVAFAVTRERPPAIEIRINFGILAGREASPAEIDALGRAQQVTAARLSELVARERAFASEASHQLRTPLTGLRLQLEDAADRSPDAVGPAIAGALVTTDRLHRTVEDLLRLARDARPPADPLVVADVVADVVASSAAPRAREAVVLRDGAGLRATVSEAALRQILAVLLENAAEHGQGSIRVRIRPAGDAVAVDVGDEGRLEVAQPVLFARRTSVSVGRGIGLALARRLAEAEGGRLRLRESWPTTFTLLLPGVRPAAAASTDAGSDPSSTG
jgi:signal transduction histidine kinase